MVLGLLGAVFGAILAYASKLFMAKTDDRISEIEGILPNVNCGACGYIGCADYAKAVVKDNASLYSCVACDFTVTQKIADIMGKSVQEKEKQKAVVMCRGNKMNATSKFKYIGLKDCLSASQIGGGFKYCDYGCLGYGNCMRTCKFNAISIVNGAAVIDDKLCTGCGMCSKSCPKNIIEMVNYSSNIFITCCSHNKAAETKSYCAVGCISCGQCVKTCPNKAIKIDRLNASIDSYLCDGCGKCIEVCPTGAVVDRR